jgi:hypothetical protein
MLCTADRSPQRSYSGNLHCSPATESHLHLAEARARQHRSRNGGDGRGAFRAIFEMVQTRVVQNPPPFDFTLMTTPVELLLLLRLLLLLLLLLLILLIPLLAEDEGPGKDSTLQCAS